MRDNITSFGARVFHFFAFPLDVTVSQMRGSIFVESFHFEWLRSSFIQCENFLAPLARFWELDSICDICDICDTSVYSNFCILLYYIQYYHNTENRNGNSLHLVTSVAFLFIHIIV